MKIPFLDRFSQSKPNSKDFYQNISSKPYPKLIIKFITFLLTHPKTIILIPALLVFILSYNVVYDFTVKKINGEFANYFGDFSINPLIDHHLYNNQLYQNSLSSTLSNINHGVTDLSNISLSKVVLASDDLHDFNVLGFDFLNKTNYLTHNLSKSIPKNPIIISPISLANINFNSLSNITLNDFQKSKIERYFLKYLNFNQNSQFISLFFDNIFKYNHFIEKSQLLNLYIIHDSNIDVHQYIPSLSLDSLKFVDLSSTSSSLSVKDFVQYYLIQNNLHTSAKIFMKFVNGLQISAIIVFMGYIFLSISNQHKIRSNFGLVFGWLLEILISATASINLISYIHNYKSWRLIFDPSTFFTKAGFIFSIMVLSSRTLTRIINDIAGDNSFESNNDIHKRLFKFYIGINTSTKNSTKILQIFDCVFRIIGIDLYKFYIPIISKVLCFNLVGIMSINFIGTILFQVYFDGNFMQYLSMRLFRFVEAVIFALFIDHFLQLTYLVGIITVDLNRYELKDLLDQQTNESDESLPIAHEVNFFSSLLLKLSSPINSRPDRSSIRYRLGQYLLKVRPSSSITFWFILFPLFQLLHFLVIITNWVILIPYNLINDPNSIIHIGFRNIIVNKTDILYYLELVSIVLLIIAISQLIFKLAHYKYNDELTKLDDNKKLKSNSRESLTTSDFELNDETKFFKSIDLINGHDLDVLKINTNSVTSFLASIGLDHKILIWSPLSKSDDSKPINLSSTNNDGKELWPINHINISNDGNFIVLINFKYGMIKCFERDALKFIWEHKLPNDILSKFKDNKLKILESFFRKKTVPGFLTRKILQKKKALQKSQGLLGRSRRGSDASIISFGSTINANFPPPLASLKKTQDDNISKEIQELEKSLNKEEYTIVLSTGELITFSCLDGSMNTSNIIEDIYGDAENLFINSAAKISTSRVSDRIVCNISNFDICVATVINNTWKFRKLPVQDDFYNKGLKVATPLTLSLNKIDNHEFKSKYDEREQQKTRPEPEQSTVKEKKYQQINRPVVLPIEFVGMFLRVIDLTAQLIDAQTGVILKTFNIGHFKPSSLKVSHSEPTHCKFCGCASIQSFSIVYEDFYDKTIIIHSFRLKAKRSKNNICLRVERDPREIRCLGFNAVTETQYWYENIESWALTDVNFIVAFRRKNHDPNCDSEEDIETLDNNLSTASKPNIKSLIEHSGLSSLRSRKTGFSSRELFSKSFKSILEEHKNRASKSLNDIWESFVITVANGKVINYKIPELGKDNSQLITNRINSISKYGFKAVAVSFGNLIKILYLGNDKLIENELYYSGTHTTMGDVFNDRSANEKSDNNLSVTSNPAATNMNELLFINKRRRIREKHSKHTTVTKE